MQDFQYIIHAACIASPTYYRRCPIETMDANVNDKHRFAHYEGIGL
jgi:nucleoside-diphosphate-sugar epimerase